MSDRSNQSEKHSSADLNRENEALKKGGNTISLVDIVLVLARHRLLIGKIVLVFVTLGAAYTLLAPDEYTSNAKVVREAQTGTPDLGSIGGLGALRGLGVNLGGATSGLSPSAFPNVLNSRNVRLAVVRETYDFPDTEQPMTFVEYANRPPGALQQVFRYTVRFPWTLKQMLTQEGERTAGVARSDSGALAPSRKEFDAMRQLSKMVSTSVDPENGLMTITLTAQDPELAAELNSAVVRHLTERVRQIRTKKVRSQLEFVENRFQEAEKELEESEERLARFLERNQDPTTASLRFERDRLRRQVNFKEQLYSELQSQVTEARIDLQRRQPVVTIVEDPVVPKYPSSTSGAVLIALSVIGGLFVAVTFILSQVFLFGGTAEEEEKVDEIKALLVPEGVLNRAESLFGLRTEEPSPEQGDGRRDAETEKAGSGNM